MRPNVAVLGFKNDWTANAIATIDYFNIIHDALHLKYGIGILRLQTGLDESDFFQPGTDIIVFLYLAISFIYKITFFRSA